MTIKGYIMLATILGATAAAGIGGALGGYEFRSRSAERDDIACHNGILVGDYKKCRAHIENALSEVTLAAKDREIEYRDRTIPVFVADTNRDAELARRYSEAIDALSRLEKTNACAASPAFRLRREQLLNDEGPSVPAQPDADQNPG